MACEDIARAIMGAQSGLGYDKVDYMFNKQIT